MSRYRKDGCNQIAILHFDHEKDLKAARQRGLHLPRKIAGITLTVFYQEGNRSIPELARARSSPEAEAIAEMNPARSQLIVRRPSSADPRSTG